MEVLTAYVRQNAPALINGHFIDRGEDEVLLRQGTETEIQAILTVLGRRRLGRRRERTDQKLDLSCTDLCGANLKRANLNGVNFMNARLEGVNFMKAHLENAHFWDAHLKEADFTDAHLSGTVFLDAKCLSVDQFVNSNDLESAIFDPYFNARLQAAYDTKPSVPTSTETD